MRQLNIDGALFVGKWPLARSKLWHCFSLLVLPLSRWGSQSCALHWIRQILGNQEALQMFHSSTFWTLDSWLRGQEALQFLCALDWSTRKSMLFLFIEQETAEHSSMSSLWGRRICLSAPLRIRTRGISVKGLEPDHAGKDPWKDIFIHTILSESKLNWKHSTPTHFFLFKMTSSLATYYILLTLYNISEFTRHSLVLSG